MTNFPYSSLSVFILRWTLTFISAATLPPNWKDFIDPDILVKSEKDQSRYDVDKMEGDINNLDLSEMPMNAGANAVDDKNSLWPNNTVPYEFTKQQSTRFRPTERRMITEAMTIIEHLTGQCVKFVQRTTEEDYVKFQKGPLCYSDIGRTGGRQSISLSLACVENYGCIQHEIMHVLGFYHEQSRSDRDEHMFINWDNIATGNKDQFSKRSGITYGLPYDYESIMHYAFNAFAVDDQLPTVVPKVARAKIGQNENLSPLDVVRIHRRFKCNITAGKVFVIPQGGPQPKLALSNLDDDKVTGKDLCEKHFPTPTCNETVSSINKDSPVNLTLLCSALLIPTTSASGIQWNGNWALGCDFAGNDLGRIRMRSEDCGGHCYNQSSCTHFAWSNWESGTCFLKTGSISKANAIKSWDPNMVCGIIRGG